MLSMTKISSTWITFTLILEKWNRWENAAWKALYFTRLNSFSICRYSDRRNAWSGYLMCRIWTSEMSIELRKWIFNCLQNRSMKVSHGETKFRLLVAVVSNLKVEFNWTTIQLFHFTILQVELFNLTQSPTSSDRKFKSWKLQLIQLINSN
jgi:hypothetical protein